MKKLVKMFAVCTLFCLSQATLAQNELQLPAEFTLKSSDIKRAMQTALPNLMGSGGVLAERWTLNKPYKTEIENIQWSGDIELDWQKSQGNTVKFVGQISSPAILVDSISIHDTIQRRVGGVDVTVRLDAECSDLEMSSNSPWVISGEIKWTIENSKLKTEVVNFDFSRDSNWDVKVGSCVGPNGIEQVLADAFKDFVSDQQKVDELIYEEISKFLKIQSAKLEDSLYEGFKWEAGNGVLVKWQTYEILGHATGDLKLFGVAQILSEQRPGASAFSKQVAYISPTEYGEVRNESGLAMSYQHAPLLVNFATSSGLLNMQMSSKSIPGLSWLLSSRLVQFFVWPDLWNFPKGVELWFKNSFSGQVKVPSIKKISGGFSLVTQAQAKISVDAPHRGQWVPYLDVNSLLEGELRVQNKKDKVAIGFSTQKLPFQLSWRSEFSALRNINRWISSSIIGSRIVSALRSSEFSFEKKPFQIGDVLKVNISGIELDQKNIVIEFTQNK